MLSPEQIARQKIEPVLLDKNSIRGVLSRFIEGTMTVETVRNWAEALELHEDIDYPEQEEEVTSEVMHALANPELEGVLTIQFAQQLMSKL